MKNILQTYLDRYQKKGITLVKASLVIVSMSFIAYSKPSSEPDSYLSGKEKAVVYKSSVSIVHGTYKIDSNVIESNRNKETLLTDLKADELIRKTIKEEIPEFIRIFLNDISVNGKFCLANPWEKWRSNDIMDLALPNVNSFNENVNLATSCGSLNELPDKKLIYFGLGKKVALLSYHTGGIRAQQHMVILKFDNEKITDMWFGESLGLYAKTRLEIIEWIDGHNNGRGC